jgi:hypothetical protein
MHLWLVVVLCVIAVVEPEQIVEPMIAAHPPGKRDIRISAVM